MVVTFKFSSAAKTNHPHDFHLHTLQPSKIFSKFTRSFCPSKILLRTHIPTLSRESSKIVKLHFSKENAAQDFKSTIKNYQGFQADFRDLNSMVQQTNTAQITHIPFILKPCNFPKPLANHIQLLTLINTT